MSKTGGFARVAGVCKRCGMRRWPWQSAPAVLALLVAGCEPAPSVAPPPVSQDAEQAQLLQCCQGLVHEAWNSDPPNPHVLHAARACESLAREGKLEQARERLRAAGHATICDLCPPNGCRPR